VLLVGLFSITCVALGLRPDWIVDAAAVASAIFMLLYVLTIISYVRVRVCQCGPRSIWRCWS
jgi:hypothetical protein